MVPFEQHLETLNGVVLLAMVAAIVPLPPRPGLRTSWLLWGLTSAAAMFVGFLLMFAANLVVTLAEPDSPGSPADWRSDVHAPQWVEQYALLAATSILLALTVRLPFTRGTRLWWALVPFAAAVACAVTAWAILS